MDTAHWGAGSRGPPEPTADLWWLRGRNATATDPQLSLSHFPLCNPMNRRTPGFPVLEFAQTPVYWVGDASQPSHPLSPPIALNLSQHQGLFPFQWALHIRWPNYWSFSFSISLSNEYLRLISFKIDWFDLLAVQGILKSLLQHHSLKASILEPSAFFMVQHSHLYMTAGKTIALTIHIQ